MPKNLLASLEDWIRQRRADWCNSPPLGIHNVKKVPISKKFRNVWAEFKLKLSKTAQQT